MRVVAGRQLPEQLLERLTIELLERQPQQTGTAAVARDAAGRQDLSGLQLVQDRADGGFGCRDVMVAVTAPAPGG